MHNDGLPDVGTVRPAHTLQLYKEAHDSIDTVLVIVAAIETGDSNFGRIYIMNSFAYDQHADVKLRDTIEVIEAASDAQAQRIGIGLFDSLVRELSQPAPELLQRCNTADLYRSP